MANSRYEYHKKEEELTELRFNRGTYIIVRLDGDKFHRFCTEHGLHKPNDKRALDLMVDSAKQLMSTYKDDIILAYGHSDEFSFVIDSTSNLLERRIFKITSMLPVIFSTAYNSNWDKFFEDSSQGRVIERKYDAWFDAKPKEYPDYRAVIDYLRWRQIDCHINNLYNTTLHALTGRYVRHELIPSEFIDTYKREYLVPTGMGDRGSSYILSRTPIISWIGDPSKFSSSPEATHRLAGTLSSDKHEIMFKEYNINYNDELEQFKKGTLIVNFKRNGQNSIDHFHVDIIKNSRFWDGISFLFEHYTSCPDTR